jgi:uncharacterized RmlC-like cupin family protein
MTDFTPEQMTSRIARFRDLKPSRQSFRSDNVGVPGEAYKELSAQNLYKVLAPDGANRSAAPPAIIGIPGAEVNIAECPPGQGAKLHAHLRTHESFMCLTGRFEIKWGADGEHSVTLEPYDMIAVPPGVFRSFTNVSDADALLLVLVQGAKEDVFGDVLFHRSIGDDIEQRYGAEVRRNFKNLGITFADGPQQAGT